MLQNVTFKNTWEQLLVTLGYIKGTLMQIENPPIRSCSYKKNTLKISHF